MSSPAVAQQVWGSQELPTAGYLEELTFVRRSALPTSAEIIDDVDATLRHIESVLARVNATADDSPGENLGLRVRLIAAWLEGLDSGEIAEALGFQEDGLRKILHGERKVQSSRATRVVVVAEILETLSRVLERPTTGRWFKTRIPDLGGLSPLEALKRHKADQVLEVVRSYLDPAYS